MAKTGFFDASQGIYLPKDSLTWNDLNTSPYATWDNWTRWYQNLSASTTVEFTTDIIDFGSSTTVVPLITITTARDGDPDADVFFLDDKPSITIEGSNVADMSSGVSSTTVDRDNFAYTNIGKFRYYRFTFNINSGINTAPQGFTGFDITQDTEAQTETIESFNTSTVDTGGTTRVIPLRKKYSSVQYVGITPTTTITDAEEEIGTGLYMVDDYVASSYVSGSAASSTEVSITTLPIARFAGANTSSIVSTTISIQLIAPNTGDDVNATVDCLVHGLPLVGMNAEGNITKI